MKTLGFFFVLVVFCSCINRPNLRELGIDRAIRIDNKYSIVVFNSKCSSNSLAMYMAKSNYSMVKTTELSLIIDQLKNKEKKHASVYKVDEFSKEISDILKRISECMIGVKAPETYSPIFHWENDKLVGDWGDFLPGSKGYVIVTKTLTKRK